MLTPSTPMDSGENEGLLRSRVNSSTKQLLEAICGAMGVQFDSESCSRDIRELLETDVPVDSSILTEVVITAGIGQGLRFVPRQTALSEIFREECPGSTVIIWSPQDHAWLILERGRRNELLVRTCGDSELSTVKLALAKLAERLAVSDLNSLVSILEVVPVAPAGNLSRISPNHTTGAQHESEAQGHGAHATPLWRISRLLWLERQDIWVVVVFAVWIGILSLAVPITVESLVNTVAFAAVLQPLVVLSAVLLIALGLAAVLRALQSHVVEIIQQRLFVRVAADLAYRLPRVKSEALVEHHGPELVNRFFDVGTVQKVGAGLLLDGIAIVLQTIIGMAILAFYHPWLLGYDLFLLLLVVGIVFGLGIGGVRTSIAESLAKYAVADWLEELTRHPRAFKGAGGADFAVHRSDALLRDYLRARRTHFQVVLRQIIGALALQAIASTVLLGLGGYLVILGELTLGQLVAAELIVTVVLGSFTKLGKHLEGFYDLAAAIDKIGHLVDLPVEPQDGTTRIPDSGPALLEMHDVHLGTSEVGEVLRGVTLRIEPGERVALGGDEGSGKSLIADLIFGLRQPQSGFLELNGIDLREIRRSTLREFVAVVEEPEIIGASIADNVRLGRPRVTAARLREALEFASIQADVAELPNGIQTRLTTGGWPLSEGQTRRLALARAVAGEPRLLIIDGTLDAFGHPQILELARRILDRNRQWSVLLITNRADLQALCDRRLSLEAGVLREEVGAIGVVTKVTQPEIPGNQP